MYFCFHFLYPFLSPSVLEVMATSQIDNNAQQQSSYLIAATTTNNNNANETQTLCDIKIICTQRKKVRKLISYENIFSFFFDF